LNGRLLTLQSAGQVALSCATSNTPASFATSHEPTHRHLSRIRSEQETALNRGAGSCCIEFSVDRIARVDVDFFSGPKPTGTFDGASEALRVEKQRFGETRRARWFGI